MIPRTATEQVLDDPRNVAGYPSADDLDSDTFDGNRLYDASFLTSVWEDAEAALEIERELVAAADAESSSMEEFDAILEADLEDWQFEVVGMLDVGVAAAVRALAAADCVTSTSCRGHHARPNGSDLPEVIFWVDERRATLVRRVASASGCSFTVDDEGRASVWGPSVEELMDLARGLIGIRQTFEALPPRQIV